MSCGFCAEICPFDAIKMDHVYELSTDDGTRYALHASQGPTLVKGARMKIRIQPAVARIWCGPGKLVEMTAAEPLR